MDNESTAADDGHLIAEAHSDTVVFVKLYRRHYEAIFRYCAHRLFDRHTAEDITAEVFLKVVENFHHFSGGEGQFRKWLYKIATNAVNDHLRKTARRDGLFKNSREQVHSYDADCGEPSTETLVILREAILSLKPRYQAIITLRFFENLKLTEVADVLGGSAGTVRSQLARSLAKLRKKMSTCRQKVLENG
ncbi:MAG: RNA polymerase sigma factor [Planctomycetota bacterium]